MIQRAKTDGIDVVMCVGNVIYVQYECTKVDQRAALSKLHDDLTHALTDEEVECWGLSKRLLPHVMKVYGNHFDATAHVLFQKPNSSV